MNEYINLELSKLIDLLSEETSVYTKLLSEKQGTEAEFAQCKERIEQIQHAIHTRLKADQNNSPSSQEVSNGV